MRQIKKGSINVSVDVYIIDATTGQPELGVLFNTPGIDLEYRRDLALVVPIVEVTLASLSTAHADGGFLEIGHGYYRLDIPDAAFVAGASKVTIQGVVSGMIVLPQSIQLVSFDPEDAADLGLSALTGNIPQTSDHTAGISAIPTTAMRGTDGVDTAAMRGTDSAATQASLDAKIPTNLTFTGADLHVTLDGETVKLSALTHTGATIPTVSTLTGHTAQSGDTFAQLPTNLSDLAITVTTGRVTAGTVSDKAGYKLSPTGVNDILRTALTEGYAADGSDPTVEQFMFMIWSMLSDFAIAGTTITAKKKDGVTTSMTFTTDHPTEPTSITRAT